MTDQDKKYLFDILRSTELIEEFLSSIPDYNQYTADLKTQSVVERQLGIIGEAVNKYDKLFQHEALVNARKTVGFRNRIIHAYDAVDSSMIWAIVSKHLPALKAEVIEKLQE